LASGFSCFEAHTDASQLGCSLDDRLSLNQEPSSLLLFIRELKISLTGLNFESPEHPTIRQKLKGQVINSDDIINDAFMLERTGCLVRPVASVGDNLDGNQLHLLDSSS
jgi:hypothetical protein